MNTEALFLFLILLLGLVICSFLGGNCGYEGFEQGQVRQNIQEQQYGGTGAATPADIPGDNYNHNQQTMTSLQNGSTYKGPDGGSAIVQTNSDGTQSLDVTLPNGEKVTLNSNVEDRKDSLSTSTGSVRENYTNYYGTNGTATTFYGPNGVNATIIKDNNGQKVIQIQTNKGTYIYSNDRYFNPNTDLPNSQYYTSYDTYQNSFGSSTGIPSGAEFMGENGGKVIVITNSNGTESLNVTLPNEKTFILTSNNLKTTNGNQEKIILFNSPYGNVYATAKVIKSSNGFVTIQVTKNNKTYYFNPHTAGVDNSTSNTQYYGSTGYNVQTYNGAYTSGPYGNAVAGTNAQVNGASATGPYGNTAYYAQGPNGGTINAVDYSSSLPPGVPASMIAPGQEDLYILKSQVVPPVCPACPAASTIPRQEPCPACKPCGRCPESSFECKKVPNYNAINSDELPVAVLNDFSTFGM